MPKTMLSWLLLMIALLQQPALDTCFPLMGNRLLDEVIGHNQEQLSSRQEKVAPDGLPKAPQVLGDAVPEDFVTAYPGATDKRRRVLNDELTLFKTLVEKHIDRNHAMCSDPKQIQSSKAFAKDERKVEKPQISEMAIRAVRTAADNGDREAQFHVGFAYMTGSVEGIYKDPIQGQQWYQKSATLGYQAAMINLGIMYLTGKDVQKMDAAISVSWFQKAADAGNVYGMHILGAMYRDGLGVKVDQERAVYLFQKASELGDAPSHFSLGKAYIDGHGIAQDDEKGIHWLTMAANEGIVGAMTNLGVFYIRGRGVQRSAKIAAEWFEKAAKAGNYYAQMNLSTLYRKGVGVKQNDQKAAFWSAIAMQQKQDKSSNVQIADALYKAQHGTADVTK